MYVDVYTFCSFQNDKVSGELCRVFFCKIIFFYAFQANIGTWVVLGDVVFWDFGCFVGKCVIFLCEQILVCGCGSALIWLVEVNVLHLCSGSKTGMRVKWRFIWHELWQIWVLFVGESVVENLLLGNTAEKREVYVNVMITSWLCDYDKFFVS